MSTADPSLKRPLKPSFPASPNPPEPQSTISTLRMQPHIEGGYFVETDRDPLRIPNPFLSSSEPAYNQTAPPPADNSVRHASTTIFYLITPGRPMGVFHRNRGRTVHTLHWGRGRYVLIHADEEGKRKRVETFVVGKNVEKGERLQWIVEGGKYKASFLMPDEEGGKDSQGLLISETVVPGFEYQDHDFLRKETFEELVSPEQAEELKWLLRENANLGDDVQM